jgi:hypothetical protein
MADFLSFLSSGTLGAVTKAIDAANWGGKLEKAQIIPLGKGGKQKDSSKGDNTAVGPVEFMFNPATIKWVSSPMWKSTRDAGSDSADKTFGGNDGRKLTLSNIIFDTFERRSSVRSEFIEKLERLALRDHKDQHDPPTVFFFWGKFSDKIDSYNCPPMKLVQLDVEYTMFLNDGTPVRAKVNMSLQECKPEQEQQEQKPNQSPDHAKLVTMRRGDTLQSIANVEYENPSEWRRIADANGIDDPLNVKPGTKLLVPPILK